jgi:hypothetical protein
MLRDAHTRSAAAGDAAVAAIVLADAATMGGRAPATFQEPPSHAELCALVEQTAALAPADDLEVALHLTLAAAWNGRPQPVEPDPDLADRALALAREFGDPVFISGALDAVASAESVAGRHKSAWRLTAERRGLLERVPRHDPHVGGEVADMYHMVTQAALAAGELEAALAGARLASGDRIGQGLAHFAATHLVVPLTLLGELDEALAQAVVMLHGWERTGRPAAGWMSPAFFSAAFVHGLRGDDAEHEAWWERAELICLNYEANSLKMYTAPRLALHRGDLDAARASALQPAQETAGQFHSYAAAMAVEVAVATGAPDAEKQLAAAAGLAPENDFAAAMLLRAAGRLHDDQDDLAAAVAQWEAIGARFERATTLLLLPARADEGRAELTALGCLLPPT